MVAGGSSTVGRCIVCALFSFFVSGRRNEEDRFADTSREETDHQLGQEPVGRRQWNPETTTNNCNRPNFRQWKGTLNGITTLGRARWRNAQICKC